MRNEEIVKKRPYIAPEMLCVQLASETKILTVSGDINDVPWEDE